MPATYNTRTGVTYTPPPAARRRPAPEAQTPPAGIQATVPPPPAAEAVTLTKTSGAQVPGGSPQGTKARTVSGLETTSNAGLPFRDTTLPAGVPGAVPEVAATVGRFGMAPPEETVLSTLASMGYDPASSNPAVRTLVDASDAIQEAFLIDQVLQNGGAGAATADPDEMARSFAKFTRDIVARGSFRQVAAKAAKSAPAAAQQLQTLANTNPELFAGNANPFLRTATDSLLGAALPQTLAHLTEQQYGVPGEETAGKAALQNLQRLALRGAAAAPNTLDDTYLAQLRRTSSR